MPTSKTITGGGKEKAQKGGELVRGEVKLRAVKKQVD
jgi:hypothetical protein